MLILLLTNLGLAAGATASAGVGSLSQAGRINVYVVSASGRTKWSDYLSCRVVTPGAGMVNRCENDGALGVKTLSSVSGLVEWVDYIPIVLTTDEGRWRYDEDGFIPIVEVADE